MLHGRYKLDYMGNWGFKPLENDAALDWLDKLFDEAELLARVESALYADIHESPEEVRAAAHLVHALSKADLWPHDRRVQFLDLAAIRLEQMLSSGVFKNACFVAEVRKEINAIRDLLHAKNQPPFGKPELN